MIVVSDTSPLNYLVLIGHIDLLPAMYGNVLIPPAVARELNHPTTPQRTRNWLVASPSWLEIRTPIHVPPLGLGAGEVEAIALANECHAERILLDDLDARREAEHHGLRVTGILGVLQEAATRNLIDFDTALASLLQTSFYASDALIARVRRQARDT